MSRAVKLNSFFFLLTLFKACYWADEKFASWALFMQHWNGSIVHALQRKCRKARSKGSADLPKTSKTTGKASARQFIDDQAQEDNRFALDDDDDDYGYYDNLNDNDSDDALPYLQTQTEPTSEYIQL